MQEKLHLRVRYGLYVIVLLMIHFCQLIQHKWNGSGRASPIHRTTDEDRGFADVSSDVTVCNTLQKKKR